jgi:hypothetical protein
VQSIWDDTHLAKECVTTPGSQLGDIGALEPDGPEVKSRWYTLELRGGTKWRTMDTY